MNFRLMSAFVFGLGLTVAAVAEDAPSAPPPANPPAGQAGGQSPAQGGGGRGMGMGRGLVGTVTAVAADHYIIKTDAGEIYTVHYSANTRMVKQIAQGPRPRQGRGRDEGEGGGYGGNPPETIKPTDIKVGDAIAAMGEIDATAKSVGAVVVAQLDPERAKQMREMQANYGKTWLMGKITAMDGVKVTIMGSVDNATHSFLADENTTFRKRRDPITLADLEVGDIVRVEGAVKDGSFLATTVNAMGAPPGGTPTVPRSGPPQ
jgi:hypothetical protein